MDILELAILTLLSDQEELSIREIGNYLGVRNIRLSRSLKELEKKGLIFTKALIGNGDMIIGITEEGVKELYKNYIVLRDLVKEMEYSLCTKFDC
ncbi:MarR family transcriptional regulator [Sulfolobus acidocaldarius]|uniref:Transcriptional regulator MarR family n=4 Tax=Sulfolobus acidocaldarius TaxID=2285 RepID=Q4J9J8_SULAC|nr:MarR family transcriptional regulator [Sulfolobus acidocaldarius]AAY80533.1 transcriptional regulator MarR family [Sulfolobus acidocaldarius DSM 639]AGE71122.1 MarR family transcriptional regulator [Sulfolobus acidocaldarius N8]AGE73392.1 MarR family transcriptional regulator [Sulfolobus acidocaldarius Ron12/I]ALU28604.1 MarR family transcriptional regulator [Sulfolobus acidocaldarius]ALU31318.1 MarR family transcriptional regulator [Sulfolobus acidocaldarius]